MRHLAERFFSFLQQHVHSTCHTDFSYSVSFFLLSRTPTLSLSLFSQVGCWVETGWYIIRHLVCVCVRGGGMDLFSNYNCALQWQHSPFPPQGWNLYPGEREKNPCRYMGEGEFYVTRAAEFISFVRFISPSFPCKQIHSERPLPNSGGIYSRKRIWKIIKDLRGLSFARPEHGC